MLTLGTEYVEDTEIVQIADGVVLFFYEQKVSRSHPHVA